MPLPARSIIKAVLVISFFTGFGCATAPSPGVLKEPDAQGRSRDGRVPVPPTEEEKSPSGRPYSLDAYKLMSDLTRSLETGEKVQVRQAERLIESAPGSSYANFLAGSIYLLNGDLDRARDQYTLASKLDPGSESAFSALGDISIKTGDLTGADQYYIKAYNAAAIPTTANRLALLRIQGGYLESAKEILLQTLADYPEDTMTRNNLAIALDMMGMTSEGIDILSGDGIEDPQLLRTRALLQLKEGRPDRATEDMESVFEALRSDKEWLLMGTADLQQGKLAQAEDKFRSAIAAHTSGYEGYLNLGLALRRQGRFTDAEKVYQEGLAKVPHPDLHLNLGVLYELYRGQPALALEQYRKYLQLKGPASDRVQEWAEYLEGVLENK